MDLRKLDRIPGVASVMTPFPYSVEIDAPVREADALMRSHDLRHVPVRDGEDIVGVVTDRDIFLGLGSDGDADRVPVRAVCVGDPYLVDLHVPLDLVVLEMAERHKGSAVVLRHGKLAGIFTATDACRILGRILAARFRGPGGGEAA